MEECREARCGVSPTLTGWVLTARRRIFKLLSKRKVLPAATAGARMVVQPIISDQVAEETTVYGATNFARLVIDTVSAEFGWTTWSRSVVLGKSAAVLFVVTTTKLVGRSFAWQDLELVQELNPR